LKEFIKLQGTLSSLYAAVSELKALDLMEESPNEEYLKEIIKEIEEIIGNLEARQQQILQNSNEYYV